MEDRQVLFIIFLLVLPLIILLSIFLLLIFFLLLIIKERWERKACSPRHALRHLSPPPPLLHIQSSPYHHLPNLPPPHSHPLHRYLEKRRVQKGNKGRHMLGAVLLPSPTELSESLRCFK